jgi:lysyl-tRNA synthetase class 2
MTDWRPTAPLRALHLRARLLADIRLFFASRGVLEVDTPALSVAGATDPHLESFMTTYTGPGLDKGKPLFLQTSPELPMKRLLAAGSGCIYQIAKVFRNGEMGRLHNPEFTLLEWYRIHFDHYQLMDEVEQLVTLLLKDRVTLQAPERFSYSEIFQRYLDLDPHRATVRELGVCVENQGLTIPAGMPEDDPDPWLDLLLSHCIQPRLGRGRLAFIFDYPCSQAALARIRPGNPPLGERFELYINGLELANGFHELGDASEQRWRFERDNQIRAARGLPTVPLDGRFLAALAQGLPPCSGVAVGLDRLVMVAAGQSSLQEVMAFPLALDNQVS